MQMSKEELIGLLQTEDSADAGIALSFVEDVDPGDTRFLQRFGGVKAALAYWLEQKKKSAAAGERAWAHAQQVRRQGACAAGKGAGRRRSR